MYFGGKNGAQIDKRSEEQKKIDDWLPITSSRNATWWASAFHNTTAMVGAGVLSLPYAMANLGWYIPYIYHIKDSIFIPPLSFS